MLRPEDVTSQGLPVAMRGYDREKVDVFLHRVSEAYLLTWRQALALRERVNTLEEELFAAKFEAQGEAEASSKAIAELVQRCSTVEDQLTKMRDQLTETRNVRSDLATKLDLAERERKQALTELQEVSQRASDLEKQVQGYSDGQRRQDAEAEVAEPAVADEEAAALLVAAVRAAEDVREASRTRAAETLVKARERAMQLHDEAERERAALGEVLERREQAEREASEISAGIQEHREQAEREANEILAGARAEAERVATSVEDERDRVRELLAGALQSLDADGTPSPDGLVSDLSSRLHEPTS